MKATVRYVEHPTRNRLRRLGSTAAVVLALALIGGCAPAKNAFVPAPPPEVTVARPVVQDVVHHQEFTGQTQAVNSIEIRARISGYLQEIHFQDGDVVHKGQLLFTIDPREYQAAVHQAEADLLNAQTSLEFAENDLKRRELAFEDNAVSELDVLRSRSERDKSTANVAGAEARLESARLNLSYTELRTPVSGKVSRHRVDVGNLVGTGEPTLLTTVRSMNPIHFYFVLNERQLVSFMRELSANGQTPKGRHDQEPTELLLALSDETDFTHRGLVDFVDNRVDPNTGTIQVRARVENDDLMIVPGLFARGRIAGKTTKDALLVPERALGVDQAGHFLMIVNDSNVVEQRQVVTDIKVGQLRMITEGISATDRVVVNGLVRARPGIEVNAQETELDAPAESAGS